MSARMTEMTDRLYAYYQTVGFREPDILARLREATAKRPHGGMQVSPEQGQFLALLVELLGARQVLEIGTFTGYSALAMALALPEDGQIVTCDVNEDWTAMAREYWQAAGVAERIQLRLAPALETLDALIADGAADSFDLAFIDADKREYDEYYERALVLVRRDGLIAIDNVLWSGRVADPAREDADTVAVRVLNARLQADEQVTISMLPIGDGLTLARRR